MKPTAYLINTARGGCVVEEDLYDACKNGIIAGAGLDAIRKEPVDPNNPLLTLDNVIIYPHIGGNTIEAAHRASYFAAMQVAEYFGLTKDEAAKISADICETVKKNWVRLAESYGLSRGAVEYMRPAFSLQP